jgi:hypothetical protein
VNCKSENVHFPSWQILDLVFQNIVSVSFMVVCFVKSFKVVAVYSQHFYVYAVFVIFYLLVLRLLFWVHFLNIGKLLIMCVTIFIWFYILL